MSRVWGSLFLLPTMTNKLTTIRPQRANANKHTQRGMGMLERSIQEDGWIGAITVAADGETFDGSARIEVGVSAGFDDAIVVRSDGSRPVVLVREDIPNAEHPRAKRLGVAANRVASVDLEWDTDVLADLNTEGALDGLWYEDELEALLAGIDKPVGAGGDDFDTTPSEGPTRVQSGDVWRIGSHRLMCGDSTNPEHVERLMGGARVQAVVTDPPYGINRDGIANDNPEGLRRLFDGVLSILPADNAVVIAFQSPRLFPVWLDALRAAGQKFERALWFYDENDQTKPWHFWLMCSQTILISSVGMPKWATCKAHHDTYVVGLSREWRAGGAGNEFEHVSVKPLGVVQDLMAHTVGETYDPFLGSGTTLIAANRTGRKCYGMELEPKYCDVILRRAEAEGIGPIERIEDGPNNYGMVLTRAGKAVERVGNAGG